MADRTTYEEAKCCPKCGKPGEVVKKVPARGAKDPKAMLHTIQCNTELCPWFETVWFVQVNGDGSIPPPQNHTGREKVYEGFEEHDKMAQQILEALEVQRQLETEQGGHGEIRSPFNR